MIINKNCTSFSVLVLMFLILQFSYGQTTIAFEDFEGSGNWSYATTHTNGQSFIDGTFFNSANNSLRLDNFWNDNSTIAFDTIDITGYSGVVFSLAYASQGEPDDNDDLYLDYGYLIGSTWTNVTVQLIDGNTITDNIPFGTISNTGQANPFNVNVPDTAINFYATIRGTYDNDSGGDHDSYFIDDVILTAAPLSNPTPQNDGLIVLQNSLGGIANQINVFTNDDIGSDGGDLDNIILVNSSSNGTVSEVSDGVFEYIPNTDFIGIDSFTYSLCDALNDCVNAIVNIEVNLGHCEPISNSNGTHYITNVNVVGESVTLNNASGDDNGYGSFLNLTPTLDVYKGNSYNVELSVSTNMAAENRSGWAVYIDLNQDGFFDNITEVIWETTNVNPIGSGEDNSLSNIDDTFDLGVISIPANAAIGNTIMRIGARRYWYPSDSCGQNSEPEEFEDYLINIGLDPLSPQDIDVFGNGNFITSGSVTTTPDNYTDFGVYDINTGALVRTFEIKNNGLIGLNLASPYVVLSGSTDFTIVGQPATTILSPGSSTTFSLAFNPSVTSANSSIVSIFSDDPYENPFTFLIEGEGVQTFADTDGDGVPDNIDVDDDNDGLTDIAESTTCLMYTLASTTEVFFVNETFGTGLNRTQINGNYAGATTTYCYEDGTGSCNAAYSPESINDGDYTVHYTITNDNNVADGINVDISNWAEDYWYAGEDHTSGDINGRMAIFNATEEPGVFYRQVITGATPNAPIQFGFYVLNIDRDDINSAELASRERPEVIVKIYDPNGIEIISTTSGLINPTSPAGDWIEISASFTTSYSQFTVELTNANLGGLGNDLAIDDIYVKQTFCDLDGDGVADIIDLDNDNDGIPNVVELGLIDDNHDATVFNDTTNPWLDINGNGLHDSYENITPIDTDNDGTPDYLDLDSDNDGIYDNVEYNGYGDVDITGDGLGEGSDYQDTFLNIDSDDSDGDGILSIMDDNDDDDDTEFSTDHGTFSYPDPLDSDGDSIPDYLDIDSNDASNDPSNGSDIDTTVYTNLDANNDGIIDGNTDSDADGLLDNFDTDDANYGSPRDLDDSYSLYFDGRNDYVEESTNVVQGLTKVSQMGWVKLDQNFTTEGVVIGQTNFYVSVLPSRAIKVYMENGSITSTEILKLNEWTHIAAVYDGSALIDRLKLYINGELVATSNVQSGVVNSTPSDLKYRIGRKPFDLGDPYYFMGEIDEVRVFNTNLTNEELQRTVYQELNEFENFNQGKVIPKDISTNSIGGNLVRYYKMDGYKEDITDDKVTPVLDETLGAKLYNIKNIYFQTAPLPYTTIQNGNWMSEATWEHGDVWDIEDITNNKDWSIVDVRHNLITDNSHDHIGLFIQDGKTFTVNNDNYILNSWYLELNGTLDLTNDSQLVQTSKSDLVTSVLGRILRRQEGNASEYWYNYWSSPVGQFGATSLIDNNTTTNNPNNLNYALSMLKENETTAIQFTNLYNEIGKVSTRWLYTYKNGVDYYDYAAINTMTQIEPGVGYTQKGTGNAGTEQQYLFEGKPNNGTILINVTDTGGAGSVPVVSKTDYMLGNPYASAIDIHKFIDDNAGVIDGTIHLWQQWSGESHNLDEYNGGYAQVNKLGSVRAYQFIGIEGAVTTSQDGTKTPSRYLPVGQGFVTEIISNGTVVFNNSQRVFIKEVDADGSYNNGSVFFRSSNSNQESDIIEDEVVMSKIRLEFSVAESDEARRELLLGFSDLTFDVFDYGYDAKNTDVFDTDLNLILNNELMTMQAYGNITNDKEVDLMFSAETDGIYTIKATELIDFSQDQEVYLRDNMTSVYHDLKTLTDYSFTSESGVFNNRFDIVFQSVDALSTNDFELENIRVYFNNNSDVLIVNGLNSDVKSLKLYSILGQEMLNLKEIKQDTIERGIKLYNINTGLYVVSIKTKDNKAIDKKIIIK